MPKASNYLNLLEEIRNTDIKSLDDYIDKNILPLRKEDKNIIKK